MFFDCGEIVCWIKLIDDGFFELVLRIDLSGLIFRLAILKKDEANSRICSSSFFEEAIHSVSSMNARTDVDIWSWFVFFVLKLVV